MTSELRFSNDTQGKRGLYLVESSIILSSETIFVQMALKINTSLFVFTKCQNTNVRICNKSEKYF